MAPQRLFVIHHGALGDLVTSFPLFSALNAAGFEIHLLCQGHLGALARSLGLVRRAYALESARFASLFQESPEESAKEAICACDAVLAVTASDTLTVGISRFFKRPIHRILPRPTPDTRVHVTRHLLSSCAEIGLIAPLKRTPPPALGAMDHAGGRNACIWIHPGAGSPMKRWPLERFMETALLLRKSGWKAAFLLGPAERCLEPVLAGAAPAFRIVKAWEIPRLLQLLKGARALVGNDSGVSHLAAFLGLATVTVFGPTDPVRWKPLGPSVAVLRGETPCAPCFETQERHCPEPVCLKGVTPQGVVKAFLDIVPKA